MGLFFDVMEQVFGLKTELALGIAVESPQRGTSEDLQRKARPF